MILFENAVEVGLQLPPRTRARRRPDDHRPTGGVNSRKTARGLKEFYFMMGLTLHLIRWSSRTECFATIINESLNRKQ